MAAAVCMSLSGFFLSSADSIADSHLAIHRESAIPQDHINYDNKKQKENAASNSSFNSGGVESSGGVRRRCEYVAVSVHSSAN